MQKAVRKSICLIGLGYEGSSVCNHAWIPLLDHIYSSYGYSLSDVQERENIYLKSVAFKPEIIRGDKMYPFFSNLSQKSKLQIAVKDLRWIGNDFHHLDGDIY